MESADGEEGPAVAKHDRGRDRAAGAFAGGDVVDALGVGVGEVAHRVVHDDAGARRDDAGSEMEALRLGGADDVTGGIGDEEVGRRRQGAFVKRIIVGENGREAGGLRS
jgi:hypothetical protein